MENTNSVVDKIPLISSYNNFNFKNTHIVIIVSKTMSQAFNEDAILLNRLFGYKLILLGSNEQYLKVNFPSRINNKIVQKLKEELKLKSAIVEKVEEKKFNIKLVEPKKHISKGQFVSSDDVQSAIQQLIDLNEQYRDFTINQIQRGAKNEYQLHIKAKELFQVISVNLYKYVPKKSMWLFDIFIKEWNELLKNINLTRNMGKDEKGKYLVHQKISAILDTLKDYIDCLYNAKAFSNHKQYTFTYSSVVEIAKINRGILNKYDK